MKQAADARWRVGSHRSAMKQYIIKSLAHIVQLSVLARVNNFGTLLVYFPLLRDRIVLPAHEKFDAPDYKRKEYVHPPPPHL